MSLNVSGAAPAWLLAAFLALGAPSTALAGDPVQGEVLAGQWCSGCHAVEPGDAGNEIAPSFDAIVRERGRSAAWLETWLSVPHEAMPDLSLSRPEIADLVAYLESLREAE